MKQSPIIYILISALTLLLGVSCGTGKHQPHLTERLFLMPQRIRIAHYGTDAGSGSGARVLSEQVSYTHEEVEEESVEDEPTKLDTTRVYTIPSVTVISKARFAPVRDGHVNVDFVIHIPKEFLSDDYQISLTPELLHNDSLVRLEDIVLRGKTFIEKQDQDYKRYNEYVSTIIDPAGYDTAFINRSAVQHELNRRRKNEINSYYHRWSRYQEFLNWQAAEQEKYDTYNIKETGKFNRKLQAFDQSYHARLARQLSTGQDTSALAVAYRTERRKLLAGAPVTKKITLGTVPAKYRDLYRSGVLPEDIEPLLPQEDDSVRIASEHVLHEQIAFNEVRDSRRQEVFQRMVVAPYRTDARYNAGIVPQYNFSYRYTQSYPVSPGLKTLRLTLKGNIIATDRSQYNVRRTDTLSYIISSMDELADGKQLANPVFTDDQRREYTRALQLLRNREYRPALDILNGYKDYNTALTLTCLGYNAQAYSLVRQLVKSADTHYLRAILCCRLQREQEAIDEFKKACRLDEQKWFRADRDGDIAALIQKYQLTIDSFL